VSEDAAVMLAGRLFHACGTITGHRGCRVMAPMAYNIHCV